MNHILDFEKELIEMENTLAELTASSSKFGVDFQLNIQNLSKKCEERKREIYSHLTGWQTVQMARHPQRPILQDLIPLIFSNFVEMHGDRLIGDDQAIIAGFARIADTGVMLIGNNKGKGVTDNLKRNFGMASPEGYRKALRLMKLAEKFGLPIVSLIDIPAAYPGKEAEARGQAEAIGKNIYEMTQLQVPIICVVIGEGGSGGALAIGVGDIVLMLTHSIYSVAPPETCATILWRDSKKAQEAANALKLRSNDLFELGIIDEIVEEPSGGAHRDYQLTADRIKTAILKHIQALQKMPIGALVQKRFDKYSSMGVFNT